MLFFLLRGVWMKKVRCAAAQIPKIEGLLKDLGEVCKQIVDKRDAGADEITRKTMLELMRLADLEIEGAKSVLYMIQGTEKQGQRAN